MGRIGLVKGAFGNRIFWKKGQLAMNMNLNGLSRIMMMRTGMLVMGMLLVTGGVDGQVSGTGQATDLGSVSTEDLIGRLQDESSEGIGTESMAWASGFMAIDDKPQFRGGILGSAKPAVSPVMRELVRRGTGALPSLIEHLSDSRPTKLTVGKGFIGKWFGKEYDPKVRVPGAHPGLRLPHEDSFDSYTVKTGDLCFVAVGQIVNRQLNAVRYQPSLCLVVNSPVETPWLAAAVKADWSGLTPADHERSLEQDAVSTSNPYLPGEALKRLMFYYPDAGTALAAQLLDRPFTNPRTDFSAAHRLIDALSCFPSTAIDQAVYSVLSRAAESHPDNINDKYERCELVYACAKRLTKPDERESLTQTYQEMMKSRFPHGEAGLKAIAAVDLQFDKFLKGLLAKLVVT